MKFSLVTLYVKDMEKSLTFYNRLLEMPIVGRHAIGQGKELVFLGTDGNVQLELIPADTEVVYSGFSIGFEAADLTGIKERLAANGYMIKREFSPAPTTTLCFLDGPNGEEIELIAYI
jgi:lactoylglutathione lyase